MLFASADGGMREPSKSLAGALVLILPSNSLALKRDFINRAPGFPPPPPSPLLPAVAAGGALSAVLFAALALGLPQTTTGGAAAVGGPGIVAAVAAFASSAPRAPPPANPFGATDSGAMAPAPTDVESLPTSLPPSPTPPFKIYCSADDFIPLPPAPTPAATVPLLASRGLAALDSKAFAILMSSMACGSMSTTRPLAVTSCV